MTEINIFYSTHFVKRSRRRAYYAIGFSFFARKRMMEKFHKMINFTRERQIATVASFNSVRHTYRDKSRMMAPTVGRIMAIPDSATKWRTIHDSGWHRLGITDCPKWQIEEIIDDATDAEFEKYAHWIDFTSYDVKKRGTLAGFDQSTCYTEGLTRRDTLTYMKNLPYFGYIKGAREWLKDIQKDVNFAMRICGGKRHRVSSSMLRQLLKCVDNESLKKKLLYSIYMIELNVEAVRRICKDNAFDCISNGVRDRFLIRCNDIEIVRTLASPMNFGVPKHEIHILQWAKPEFRNLFQRLN